MTRRCLGGGSKSRRISSRSVGWLLLDDEQVVAAAFDHLLADGALAEEGIASEHAPLPVDALDEVRSNAQLRLGLVEWRLIVGR